ncbi:MAG: metallopeptidase family protein [Myxococcota bacterium]|nr:metallopeptidase family protein [Myxococcota bacterium]
MNTRDEQLEAILDQAEAVLDTGDAEKAIAICDHALSLFPGHPGALFVRGDSLRVLGDMAEAAQSYRAAALARPDHASSWASLALTAFELLNLTEADRSMKRAIREDPANPQAWWVRSLLREWRSDISGADRARIHAAWLDPIGFPLPPTLTEKEIDAIVEACLLELPQGIRDYLSNVVILLEDLPGLGVLQQYDPPASPLQMLGYFSGPSLMDRGEGFTPWSQLPANIILYRRNLQRHALSREHLIEELRITLLHEVGHFLGLDEADLEKRGLD